MAQSTTFRVRLTPRGGRNALSRWECGVLHARVAAAPVDGAANSALVALLAQALRVSKSQLSITAGHTSREKSIRVDGLDAAELERRLLEAVRCEE